VALDADDNVYVLNRGNGRNGTVVVFDSYGYPLATNAVALTNANGIALDNEGDAYVTASNNLFRITFSSDFTTNSTTPVTNVAGANLQGIVVMDSGWLAACDSALNGIYLINPTNGVITNLTGFHGAGDNDTFWQATPNYPVTKAYAMFNQPMGLAKAGNNMLVVADYRNNRVKAVDSFGTVTNLYGVSSNLWCGNCSPHCTEPSEWPGWYDGPVTVPDACGDVSANLPNGVLFAPSGTVYVTEDYYHLIRSVTNTTLPPVPPPPPPPPAAPTILTVLTNYGQVSLTWSTSPGATNYNVKRSTSSGGPYTTIASTSSTGYTDMSVLDGTTYYYVVSAVGAGGEGPNSAQVTATPPLPPVPDPQIGYVDFPATTYPIPYISVFHPVSSFVANNDIIIVIQGAPGSQTFYTYGPTSGSIPDPTSASASAPVGYQDGLSPSQVADYAVPQNQTLPDLTIKAIGEKPDGSPNSAIVQARFQFITANPIVTGNNAAQFTVSDLTTNAEMWYTVDGSNPTNAAPSVGPISSGTTLSFDASTNLTFKVRAFRDNYQPSDTIATTFSAANYNPVVLPPPVIGWVAFTNDLLTRLPFSVLMTSPLVLNNDVTIEIAAATNGSQIYFTSDGTNWSTPPPYYQDGMSPAQVPPSIASPCMTIEAIAKLPPGNGPARSPIATMPFQFITANPLITGNNAAQFTISDITADAHLYYTLDGSDPSSTNGVDLGTVATPTNVWNVGFPIVTNTLFNVRAFRNCYLPSAIVSNSFLLSNFVPNSSINPNSGYYPMGQTITVSNPPQNSSVYYTADGSDPTTNSLPVTMSGSVGYIKWFNSTNDLRGLRVKAFTTSGATDTIAGQPATTNTIGIPPDFNPAIYAGIGSQIVVPVVVNLQANAMIQSCQFRVEVSPTKGTNQISGFAVLGLGAGANDFIPLAWPVLGGAPGSITVNPYTNGSTAGLEIAALGPNAMSFQNFAVVALLRIAIPSSANQGDSYALAVNYPSATSDGNSASVPLTAMAPATVLVTNIAYTVGDSASISGGWYNAGEFGDTNLDNSDVNLAFNAALGMRVPYAFSDVFNAMDAYPVDAPGFVGGDGQIRFLDWNVILQRALRLDTNNWARAWSAGGNLVDFPATLTASNPMPKDLQPKSPPPWPWYRQALIGAVSTGNAVPGRTVNVPVYVKLSDGAALSGVQFRAVVTPQGGAPSLTQAPQLSPASGVPGPTLQQSFEASDAGFGWALGSFNYLSRSSNFLGWVTFTIPATAQSGQTYSVSFANADGAPNLSVEYDFETRSAWVAVGGPAPPASICSDEWKIHFFGSLTNPSAGDLADPDGDGVPNWIEYLAGTDPTDPNSRLQLSGSVKQAGKAQSQMAIHWLTAPGKAYEVQWSSTLLGGSWNTLAAVSGDGTVASCSDTNIAATVRYYRLHLLP